MRTILMLAGVALAVASGSLRAKDEILVWRTTFDPKVISRSVGRCGIPQMVDEQLALELEKVLPAQIVRAGEREDGITLKVRVTDVFGSSGGAWSGEKGIALRAQLFNDGRLVGSEEFSRRMSGGATGLVSGTCPVFKDIVRDLTENVSAWLGRMVSTKGKER